VFNNFGSRMVTTGKILEYGDLEEDVMSSRPQFSEKQLEDAFRLGEANMRLEGLDPASDGVYRTLKADILEGKIDFDEAVDSAVLSVARRSHTTAA
jgi:hypothetical protein